MGQGYSSTTLSAGSAGIDVPGLGDISFEKSLGDARFMKAVRARHRDGVVVVKVVMKPYTNMKFKPYIDAIERERKILADIPNAQGYHRVFETSSNGYLVRQFIYSSLYDRLSTRPFLEDIEKRWLAFQLLTVVRDCHSQNVFHGDIKTENTLVTSWNWLYLTDFSSSFKPTYLPEDNPADFSFFFDMSGRRTCYIAPERFLSTGESSSKKIGITWAMDIFSVGCVIAELFLETPIFTLSQLFKYRQGEHDPNSLHLSRIEDSDVRELVMHMIQLEPESRYSADEYLNFWRQKAFPDYFYSFLHQYMHVISDPSSGRAEITTGKANLGESDDRIDRVYSDFDKISFLLGYDEDSISKSSVGFVNENHSQGTLPLHANLAQRRSLSKRAQSWSDRGSLLFLGIVTSAIRSTARSSAKLKACDLLLAFSYRLPDEAKLDRVLPFIISLLDDKSDIVKAMALRTLSQLVNSVSVISPVNAFLFPEYIIPRLLDFSQQKRTGKTSALVRIAYAQSMSPIVESAARFLDSTQALKAEGSLMSASLGPEVRIVPPSQDLYDVARADLLRFFESQSKSLLTDSDANVRRAFLGSVASLCLFFGNSNSNDVILSHLNTYLNDRDWRLKCAFFETIVGVATYVGSHSLEEFILPLMIQALTDPEEAVVERVLRSLSTMAQLGLFQRSVGWDLIYLVARFIVHPNLWIREAAICFVSSSSKYLSNADCYCLLMPLVRDYLSKPPSSFSEVALFESMKSELPRAVFDLAGEWATKAEKSVFWSSPQNQGFLGQNDGNQITPSQELSTNLITKSAKSEEDQQWIRRLQNAGLKQEDEFKLLALREHIYRKAKRKAQDAPSSDSQKFDAMINLGELKMTLNNVLFDQKQDRPAETIAEEKIEDLESKRPQTIADALLDASTTIGLPDSRRYSSTTHHSVPRSFAHPGFPDSNMKQTASPKISSPLASSPRNDSRHATALSQNSDASPIQRSLKHSRESPYEGERPPSLDVSQVPNRLRSGAIDLMSGRGPTGKSPAATSSSSENATGQVEVARGHGIATKATSFFVAQKEKPRNPHELKYERAHNYNGRDPNILKILDNVFLEQYPVDTLEFGPNVTPVNRRQDLGSSTWHYPFGTLIAMFSEHTAAVTCLVPAPDHAFFLTGSDDGSVKVWDTSRLERNLAHRSRQTFRHSNDCRITSLAFVENTHTFISAASDGFIHVVHVDCSQSPNTTSKYKRLKTLRQWQVPATSNSKVHLKSSSVPPHATKIFHFKNPDSQMSTLILSTSDCELHVLDLRTMEIKHTLSNPTHHGIPTTFCVDPDRQWLLLGTAHGILDLWDLRFQLRLKSAGFPAARPVQDVALFPGSRGKLGGRKVCVAGGTGEADITIWEVERLVCREAFRTEATGLVHGKASSPYSAWRPDETPPTGLLDRLNTLNVDATQSLIQSAAIYALAPSVSAIPSAQPGLPSRRHGYLIAGGSDGVVRYWDLEDPENSRIISGADYVGAGEEQSRGGSKKKAKKASSNTGITTYERVSGVEMTVWEERVIGGGPVASLNSPRKMQSSRGSEASSSRKANVGVRRDRGSSVGSAATDMTSDGAPRAENEEDKAAKTTTVTSKNSKQTAVSQQQHRLLRSHLDAVLACCILESPFRMVVSADRNGAVYVFG